MEPADPAMRRPLYPLAPDSQTACYLPWLKVRVPIRAALRHPWSTAGWAEVKEQLPGLMAAERRLRQGWLN